MLTKVAATIIVLLIIVMPVFAEYSDPVRPQIPTMEQYITSKNRSFESTIYKEPNYELGIITFEFNLFDNTGTFWCEPRIRITSEYVWDENSWWCIMPAGREKWVNSIMQGMGL